MTDEGGHGVGFCPMDYPLVSLDTPGCWRYSLDFVPKKPVAYVNLFNNQWNTNFRLWNRGHLDLAGALVGHRTIRRRARASSRLRSKRGIRCSPR